MFDKTLGPPGTTGTLVPDRVKEEEGAGVAGFQCCISGDCYSVPHRSEPETEFIFSSDKDFGRSLTEPATRTLLPVTGGFMHSTRTERISFY